jgi:hypothetical protein
MQVGRAASGFIAAWFCVVIPADHVTIDRP